MLTIKKQSYKAVIAAGALAYILPLYVALVNAFKNLEQIVKTPLNLPRPVIFDNFPRALKEAQIPLLYKNSIVITLLSLLVLVTVCSMMGYVFARRKNRVSALLFALVLSGLMIPVQTILIPSMKTLAIYKLLGHMSGLIMFYAGAYMSIGTFLFTEFIKTIPRSLDESASIDGASQFRTFFQIIFPLLKPCTTTVVIFQGMWIWNEFLPPLYILGSSRGKTITIGIYQAIGLYTTDWTLVFPCVILASLPIVAVYLTLQKQFQSGIISGSIK